MGMENRSNRQFGVQFHPESCCTGFGAAIVGNFIQYCVDNRARPDLFVSGLVEKKVIAPWQYPNRNEKLKLYTEKRKIQAGESWLCSEALFDTIYDKSDPAFFLDNALAEKCTTLTGNAISIIGGGKLSKFLPGQVMGKQSLHYFEKDKRLITKDGDGEKVETYIIATANNKQQANFPLLKTFRSHLKTIRCPVRNPRPNTNI